MKRFILEEENNLTLKEAFEIFIIYKRSLEKVPHTIKYYTSSFNYFCNYYDELHYCSTINSNIYTGYRNYLLSKNIKNTTVNNKLRGIKTFFNYCIKHGYIEKFYMELVVVNKEVKSAYTDDELKLLFKKPSSNNFCEYRNWVLVQYLFRTGQRLGTVCNIKNKDLDLDDGVVLLTKTKSHRQQILPLSSSLIPILREYTRKVKGQPDDYLFCNVYGNKLSENGMEEAIRKYNRKRGVSKTSMHLFRHTFARKVVYSGASAFELKDITPALCWYDINPNNILVDDNSNITGFLDPGGARYAPKEWDIAFIKMDLCKNKKEYLYFINSYIKDNTLNFELLDILSIIVELDDIAFQLETNTKCAISFDTNYLRNQK